VTGNGVPTAGWWQGIKRKSATFGGLFGGRLWRKSSVANFKRRARACDQAITQEREDRAVSVGACVQFPSVIWKLEAAREIFVVQARAVRAA